MADRFLLGYSVDRYGLLELPTGDVPVAVSEPRAGAGPFGFEDWRVGDNIHVYSDPPVVTMRANGRQIWFSSNDGAQTGTVHAISLEELAFGRCRLVFWLDQVLDDSDELLPNYKSYTSLKSALNSATFDTDVEDSIYPSTDWDKLLAYAEEHDIVKGDPSGGFFGDAKDWVDRQGGTVVTAERAITAAAWALLGYLIARASPFIVRFMRRTTKIKIRLPNMFAPALMVVMGWIGWTRPRLPGAKKRSM